MKGFGRVFGKLIVIEFKGDFTPDLWPSFTEEFKLIIGDRAPEQLVMDFLGDVHDAIFVKLAVLAKQLEKKHRIVLCSQTKKDAHAKGIPEAMKLLKSSEGRLAMEMINAEIELDRLQKEIKHAESSILSSLTIFKKNSLGSSAESSTEKPTDDSTVKIEDFEGQKKEIDKIISGAKADLEQLTMLYDAFKMEIILLTNSLGNEEEVAADPIIIAKQKEAKAIAIDALTKAGVYP